MLKLRMINIIRHFACVVSKSINFSPYYLKKAIVAVFWDTLYIYLHFSVPMVLVLYIMYQNIMRGKPLLQDKCVIFWEFKYCPFTPQPNAFYRYHIGTIGKII